MPVTVDDPARPNSQEEALVREDPHEYVAPQPPPLQEQEAQEQEDATPVPVEVDGPAIEEPDIDDPMLLPTSGTKRLAREATKRIKAGDIIRTGACEAG